MNCEIANDTRIGRRPYNEDRIGYWLTDEAILLAVADGLGGHAYGALAAELSVGFIVDAFRRAAQPRLADPDLFLFRSLGRMHAMLCAHARDNGLPETPRTTMVACVVQDGRAYWMHVGDSRLYLVRDGEIAARTSDQTLVQELLASGKISELEAESHPQRSVLLQCLGGPVPPRLEPAAIASLRRGDVILLCSDGFSGPLTPRDIGQRLQAAALQDTLSALASEAEARAGAYCDNLSVLAMAWQEDTADADDSRLPRIEPALEAAPDYLSLSDADIEREIDRLRQEFRAYSARVQAGEYMTDEEIAREIERIRQAFLASLPLPLELPRAASPLADEYMSDDEIEREIERIRHAFRVQRAAYASQPGS